MLSIDQIKIKDLIHLYEDRTFGTLDLKKASESKDYCDEIKGIAKSHNLEITELSTHLQGQLVAVHPAYDTAFDGFAAPEVRGNPKARQEWAVNQLMMAAKASKNLGLDRHVTFSGALAWPYVYPWPQRPEGLIENAERRHEKLTFELRTQSETLNFLKGKLDKN